MTLTVGEYVLGVLWVVVVGTSLTVASVAARRTLLPGWRGAPAHLADAVLVLALVMSVARLLGAIGLLRWGWMLGTSLVVAAAVVAWARRRPVPASDDAPSRRVTPARPLEAVAAVAVVALVAAQWSTHVAYAFGHGMTHTDTLWYHGPFTAHFLQTGRLDDLGTLGYSEARYYPLEGELLHTVLSLPFHRDLLVPITTLGFAAMALAAAWCIGRRAGAGALAVLTTATVLCIPTIAGTQPGQASTDLIAAALLLGSVAIFVEGRLARTPMAISGTALGLAVAAKIPVWVPAAVIAVGGIVVLVRAHRRRATLSWIAAIVLFSGFWFGRNWVLTGTPVPYLSFDIGPFEQRALVGQGSRMTLLSTLDDLDEWGAGYLAWLRLGFGPLWAVLLVLALGGGVAAAVVLRGMLRVAGVAVVLGAAAHPLLPYTGEISFRFNIRYLVPTLMLAMPLVAVVAARLGRIGRTALVVVCAVLIATVSRAPHHETVPAWPGYALVAASAAVAVLAVAVFAGAALIPRRRLFLSPRATASAVVAIVIVAVAGWPLQRHYLDHRYGAGDQTSLDHPLYVHFQRVTDDRVDVFGTSLTYPFFGGDLSNDVTDHSAFVGRDPSLEAVCRDLRSAVADAPAYVVVATRRAFLRPLSAPERGLAFGLAPGVTVVVDDEHGAIYHVADDLDPASCTRPLGS